ncbi:MAG: 50S ribosomal protein L11 methyltransferase [Alphaproteobacteria bacterium]|nr:50S ribosomal protein L11 methyltransferase [Alphaproteobacteria bacterium]
MSALATLSADAAAGAASQLAALRPSEYTAALIQVLRARAAAVRGRRALEIGSGSGVVLAALGGLGAAGLCGVDIEGTAVAAGALLLHRLGYGDRLEMHRGDMWQPLAGRRFDLVAANLPQFPMDALPYGGRLPSWSSGGADGRRLLDRLLNGLAAHLAPGGRAVLTHNAFIDLELTREIVARDGLSLRIAMSVLVNLGDEKLDLMSRQILIAEEGRSIQRYGPYALAEMHVVEIGADLG